MSHIAVSELVELHSYLGSVCRLLESTFSASDHPANDLTPFLIMILERMAPIIDALDSGQLEINSRGVK